VSLLDGDIASIFSAVFSPIYLDATLYRATTTNDGQGGGSTTFIGEPVKAQLDSATYAMQQAPGYVDGDQRILVLANGVAQIGTDDQISVKGERWMIASVSLDPAGVAYELRGRRA
jgi:hypothetical protein